MSLTLDTVRLFADYTSVGGENIISSFARDWHAERRSTQTYADTHTTRSDWLSQQVSLKIVSFYQN